MELGTLPFCRRSQETLPTQTLQIAQNQRETTTEIPIFIPVKVTVRRVEVTKIMKERKTKMNLTMKMNLKMKTKLQMSRLKVATRMRCQVSMIQMTGRWRISRMREMTIYFSEYLSP
jgi:hypothetical protein